MTLEMNGAFLGWLQLSLKSKHNEQKRKNRVKMDRILAKEKIRGKFEFS
jgi:hypothetical protein